MLIQQTLDMLHSMGLSGMAAELEEQLRRPNMTEFSFEDRIGLMVDRESLERDQRRSSRRLKGAHLKVSACIEDIDYRHRRGLDKAVVLDLGTCRWITARRNLIITGATGLGKTWLACALADRACRQGFTSEYKRIPRLVDELALARADGSYLKVLARLARVDLLILD
jgi:DNA replication protein DnaC